MISIEHCRKILNRTTTKYSEEEIKRMREYLYQMAAIDVSNYFKCITNSENIQIK